MSTVVRHIHYGRDAAPILAICETCRVALCQYCRRRHKCQVSENQAASVIAAHDHREEA